MTSGNPSFRFILPVQAIRFERFRQKRASESLGGLRRDEGIPINGVNEVFVSPFESIGNRADRYCTVLFGCRLGHRDE